MNEKLIEQIRACPSLPSLPAIAVQVLNIAQSPEADLAEMAKLITQDPALSGKILRTVNSSFYGRPQHVATISQALVILGLQSVKTLVLGFSLVTNLKAAKATGFSHMRFWKRSVYAATAARVLCKRSSVVQHEEVFLATLMADIGMLVLDQVLGAPYGQVVSAAGDHVHLPALEAEKLGLTHADVGGIMAESWKLPALLLTPIAQHHNTAAIEDPALRRLAEVVELAGRCADVFVDDAAGAAISDVRAACMARNNMSEAECNALLAEIGTTTREVANLFEINIGSPMDFEKILKKANETLIEITLQTQQRASIMMEQASVYAEQANQLEKQNAQLKEAATTDGLTGLGNRHKFDTSLESLFSEAKAAANAPLSLILIDLDHFKKVNDVHGHPAGDAVLRSVARLLRTTARAQDVACRYGGEEMALLLPNTTRATAAATAEQIRRVISAKPVPIPEDGTLAVSASLGVATFEPGCSLQAPAHLVKAADMALYNAKHAGRNCVKVFTMKAQAVAA